MSKLRAIETCYKGYRFRSRLEARWAVFFDALGLQWEYEPEGFETSAGWYLPDFWVPALDCWIEIKGTPPTQHEDDLAQALCIGKGTAVAIFIGLPRMEWPRKFGRLHCWDTNESGGGYGDWSTALQVTEGRLAFDVADVGRHDLFSDPCMQKPLMQWARRTLSEDDADKMNRASDAAKAARFEHGESPQ